MPLTRFDLDSNCSGEVSWSGPGTGSGERTFVSMFMLGGRRGGSVLGGVRVVKLSAFDVASRARLGRSRGSAGRGADRDGRPETRLGGC